ncbi:MAG: ribosome assembly factor SBDS [Candidatus Bathyarchaeota archaeon]|nr:ribosome assembly factor SBDS [Candidatus Bathyarchaeota archaeon]
MSRNYTIARISIGGGNFEILVKPDPAFAFRSGKSVSMSDILITDVVFTDANKGLRAPEKKLKEAFGTADPIEVAKIILKKGNLQLTAQQRRQMIEEKRRQIIDFISRNAIDPRTKLPHPPTRIEQALEQVHFPVDPFKSVEEQVNEAVKALRAILPLSIEKISVAVKVPAEYAGKSYGTLKSFGTIKNENWLSDGSLLVVLEIPVGLHGPLLEKMGELTRGNAEIKILK